MSRYTRQDVSINAAALLFDRRLLVTLFVGFRLLLLIVYLPLFQMGGERGLSAGGDFFTYYQLGALSREGLLPFRDWWSEFPPVPSLVNVALYQLFGRDYTSFALSFALLMLIFDVGNLLLVRRIGMALHGAGVGALLGWVYSLLLAPTVFMSWNFEPMVAFFLLWGLAELIDRRDVRSALAALAGAFVKFTPALLIGAVWRFLPPRRALIYSAIVIGGFGLVYGFLFTQTPAMTMPSLMAQFNKASYQTVWALIDGNYRTGNFGPIQERLDPANAWRVQGNPSVVPGVVRLGAALAIGALIFFTARRRDSYGVVAFTALALHIFFLQAQGWSPQWLMQLVPLLLLCFPSRVGITGIVLLTGAVFIEYPFLFIRTGDTGGEIAGELLMPFTVLVVTRTLILIGFSIALYRALRRESVVDGAAV
jgi:hypothetical protein